MTWAATIDYRLDEFRTPSKVLEEVERRIDFAITGRPNRADIEVWAWAELEDLRKYDGAIPHYVIDSYGTDDQEEEIVWRNAYVYYRVNGGVGGFVQRDAVYGNLCTGGSHIVQWGEYLNRKACK
jgi:hypothetical protein